MATRTLPDRKLTFGDYLHFPQDRQRHEIIGGVHHVSPSPILPHQAVVTRLGSALLRRIEEPGLGRVLVAPFAVQLGPHDVVEPDVLVVLNARAEILTRKRALGAPDLVVEVLSPSTKAYDHGIKRELYERSRVSECWLVDPEAHTVEQLVLSVNRYEKLGVFTDVVQLRIAACEPVDLRSIF
jgi:Uma2 family endonuclease